MKNIDTNQIINIPSPSYVCEEKLLLNNLQKLKKVQDEADVSILLALKGFH
jgi:carboxynorspermidine decarboxylase